MLHVWMSHVTYPRFFQLGMAYVTYVTHVNSRCYTYQWVTPRSKESCHTYEWVVSHSSTCPTWTGVRHACDTCKCVIPHVLWVMSRSNESCHTQMSHVTHLSLSKLGLVLVMEDSIVAGVAAAMLLLYMYIYIYIHMYIYISSRIFGSHIYVIYIIIRTCSFFVYGDIWQCIQTLHGVTLILAWSLIHTLRYTVFWYTPQTPLKIHYVHIHGGIFRCLQTLHGATLI